MLQQSKQQTSYSTHQLLHTASYVEVILFEQLGVVFPQWYYSCYHHFLQLTFIFPIEKRESSTITTAIMSILVILMQ